MVESMFRYPKVVREDPFGAEAHISPTLEELAAVAGVKAERVAPQRGSHELRGMGRTDLLGVIQARPLGK